MNLCLSHIISGYEVSFIRQSRVIPAALNPSLSLLMVTHIYEAIEVNVMGAFERKSSISRIDGVREGKLLFDDKRLMMGNHIDKKFTSSSEQTQEVCRKHRKKRSNLHAENQIIKSLKVINYQSEDCRQRESLRASKQVTVVDVQCNRCEIYYDALPTLIYALSELKSLKRDGALCLTESESCMRQDIELSSS